MKRIALFLFLLASAFAAVAQIPPAPNPPRLVNDFAELMNQQQVDALERRLVAFNDSTSNMICVVTVNSFNGLTAHEFAYEIGDKWGVKSRAIGKNNGVVILIKPKNETDGEVRIEVGYDLEAVLPDAFVSRLAADTMVPHFKVNDYYGAVEAALDVMLPIISGEISYKEYDDETGYAGTIIFSVVFLLVLIFTFIFFFRSGGKGKGRGNGNFGGDSDLWKWIIIGSLLSDNSNNDSSRHGGYDGGYGGFGDYGGGFGGGFGGFGGSGGFGGGGGGSRW